MQTYEKIKEILLFVSLLINLKLKASAFKLKLKTASIHH